MYTLEKFECEGDVGSVASRWERWKRGLNIYIEATGIDSATKKRACLLHFGGHELQEIFYNIPGANITSDTENVFDIAIKKLDEYFAPKQSKVYERHIFRLLKQEPQEKFEKFLVRLRQQASKCLFDKPEEHIIDQITEKCASDELRKKILKTGDEFTLNKIISEANALEAVDRQILHFENKDNNTQAVNKVYTQQNKVDRQREPCGRCGNQKHIARDKICPARDKTCLKCGLIGHFRKQCRTKQTQKRKLNTEEEQKSRWKKSRSNNIEGTSNVTCTNQQVDYIFNIDNDAVIKCKVGGSEIDMLIDSGCNHNLITDETWATLKKNRIPVTMQDPNPKKNFLAYGCNSPLELLGSFRADLQVGLKSEPTMFYVIKNGTRDLLGKISATSLGVLKMGLNVNQIQTEVFPKFAGVLVEIPIDYTVKPVAQPYRRIPIPLEEKVNKKIDQLLTQGIIEEVKGPSTWISPIVPISKDDGDVRICVDMRRANTAVKRENHPLPTMDQQLPKMRNAKIFSKLDIKDAFHHIELHPDSRHITTFITSKGLFQYKRMMFGISCAPEIFQKTLERILIKCEGVINFIDDILVYGKNLQEHDSRLEKVLQTLDEHKVMLRKEKCVYRTRKVQFLGHELSEEGIKPLQKYISTIREFRPPESVSELQSFLGLVTFIGKWIPHLATTTEPLKIILRKRSGRNTDITREWGEAQQTAFNKLKAALVEIPSLGYYNPDDRTVVVADASPVGLGAVLVQTDNRGARIIAYGNKTLSECERRYCQTEKEALALVWAVEHFDIFLQGKEFELVTDHKPLETIFGPKSKPCARIERWVLRLQSYKYKVKYEPGKNNIADSLSRLCKIQSPSEYRDNYVQNIVEQSKPAAVSLQEIIEYSRQDPEIQKIKKGIYNEEWDDLVKNYKIFQSELCFYGDILLRGTKIIIPTKLRERVLRAAHEGHPGIVAMKARLRTKVWWAKCDKDAENMCKACKGCILVSAPNPPNPIKRRVLPTEPWADLAVDLMGPLPSTDYLLVAVDYFSRYKEIKICRSITSADIINHLKDIFSRFGNPATITADNGKQFTSAEFKAFCTERNIKLYNTIPYWPQQNGEVERQNRDILKRLKISQAEKANWKEGLRDYLVMYNSTPHTITGKTPAELFFRRQFRDKLPMIQDVTNTNNPEDMETRDRDRELKERGKEYIDRKRHATTSDIGIGDKVYVKNLNKNNKLSLNYEPSTHTVESSNNGDIQLRNDETGQHIRRNVVHLKRVEGQWQVQNQDSTQNDDHNIVTDTQKLQ